MSPDLLPDQERLRRFPRVSGDEPCCEVSAAVVSEFSPRERG